MNPKAESGRSEEVWALPLSVLDDGRLGAPEGSGLADRLRLILAVAPGERPLLPEFGCALHRLDEIETPRQRQLAAALVEESLDRWAPWARIERVEVARVDSDRVCLVISTSTEKMELEIDRVTQSDGIDRDEIDARS